MIFCGVAQPNAFFIKAPDENFSIQQSRHLPVTEEAELYELNRISRPGDLSLFPFIDPESLLFQTIL